MWLTILVAAPLVVLVLAAGLFSVELPLVLALAVLLVVARFRSLAHDRRVNVRWAWA